MTFAPQSLTDLAAFWRGTMEVAGRRAEASPAMETVHWRDNLMPKVTRVRAACAVDGCERASHALGLCGPHRMRLEREGSTDRPVGLRLATIEARFMAKVERRASSGCWRWVSAQKGNGYGIIAYKGRVVSAHRVAYELFVGPIPDGLTIDHLCHTADRTCPGGFVCLHRLCVNPAHLQAVTRAENLRRGQGFAGRQTRQTHCIHGHAFDAENTRLRNGHRSCRACERVNNARRRTKVA